MWVRVCERQRSAPPSARYLSAARLVLHVVCGADLGPDVLQVGHGRCGGGGGGDQRSRRAALQRAGRLGRGAHHGDLLDLVGLGRRLGGLSLAGRGLGRPGAALAALRVCSNRRITGFKDMEVKRENEKGAGRYGD